MDNLRKEAEHYAESLMFKVTGKSSKQDNVDTFIAGANYYKSQMTPYQQSKLKKLKTDLTILAIMVLCCGGMIYISSLAHKARKKPSVQATESLYPSINNHNIKPLKTN
jgi:hypothetical protein